MDGRPLETIVATIRTAMRDKTYRELSARTSLAEIRPLPLTGTFSNHFGNADVVIVPVADMKRLLDAADAYVADTDTQAFLDEREALVHEFRDQFRASSGQRWTAVFLILFTLIMSALGARYYLGDQIDMLMRYLVS